MSYMPQSGLNKTRSPYFAVQFENLISSNLPSSCRMFSTLPDTTMPANKFNFRFAAFDDSERVQLVVGEQLWRSGRLLPFPDRRTESILVIINAVAFQFLVAERQCGLAGRAQVNRANSRRR